MNKRSLRISLVAPIAALGALLLPSTSALAGITSPTPTAAPTATPTAAPTATPTAVPSPTPVGPYRSQTSPVEEHLHGIFAFDSCHAWSVGEEAGDGSDPNAQSSVIATTDGGKTWKKQTFPSGSASKTTMNRVFFTSATSGYAAGESTGAVQVQQAAARADQGSKRNARTKNSAKPRPAQTSPPAAPSVPNFLTTTDGGNTWIDRSALLPTETKNPSGGNADIEGLTALNDKVWIAAEIDISSSRSSVIAYSANRGLTWKVQQSLTDEAFASVSMFDANNGFAVSDAYTGDGPGTGSFWRTVNGGVLWTRVASTVRAPEGVWATGPNSAATVEEAGNIEYTTNGTTLFPASLPASASGNDLLDIAFGGGLNGIASGELNGKLLETADGGKNWTSQTANSGNNNFNGVTMAQGTTVSWVTGESGVVAGNTDPSVGCVAAGQLPASATPKLPAAGIGKSFEGPMWVGFALIVLMGIGVGLRAVAQRVRTRV